MKGRKEERELKTLEAVREWKEVSLFQNKWIDTPSKREKEEWREREGVTWVTHSMRRKRKKERKKDWLIEGKSISKESKEDKGINNQIRMEEESRERERLKGHEEKRVKLKKEKEKEKRKEGGILKG